ncbi:MAG: hypothetical protein AAF358_21800 [Pseudomonadota bacterium]
MFYDSGQPVLLGDLVELDVGPGEQTRARVVMVGEDYSHSGVEESFERWVREDRVLSEGDVVVEMSECLENVESGNYMFTSLSGVKLIERVSKSYGT